MTQKLRPVDAAGEHCCAPFCDLDAPDPSAPCEPGPICRPIFDGEATPDADNVGVCGDPA